MTELVTIVGLLSGFSSSQSRIRFAEARRRTPTRPGEEAPHGLVSSGPLARLHLHSVAHDFTIWRRM